MLALLVALTGKKLIVELRNDVVVTAKLAEVDEHMNLTLEQALLQPVQGPSVLYPTLFLRGSNIRFVHLPRAADAAAILDAHREKLRKGRVAAARSLLSQQHTRLPKGVEADV